MRIIDTIMSSILGRAPPPTMSAGMAPPASPREPAPTVTPTPPRRTAETAAPAPPRAEPEPAPPPTPTKDHPPSSQAQSQAQPASTPKPVDVAAVLDARAEETDEELNWRTSIVDLMKLLKLDSSLNARKALAKELKYTGDTNDSAAMNMWLQKQVMARLVEGGGKLPSDVVH